MFKFLSKFNLATRIYALSFLLGGFIVIACFFSVFAINRVHKAYLQAENLVESTQQITSLEAYLTSFNRSLYSFEMIQGQKEKESALDSFENFQLKAENITSFFKNTALEKQYQVIVAAFKADYDKEMKEMFSLFEKKIEASQTVQKLIDKTSQELADLIEETSLPSASFALNSLKEQLNVVLSSINTASPKNIESKKQLKTDFASLKQARTVAGKAEMINAKKLKKLFASMTSLEEETNRKLKIEHALNEKILFVTSLSNSSSKKLKELLEQMNVTCFEKLKQADSTKIFFQKIFVFMAAFGGLLATALAFLCLFGIRYPLSRLIQNAQEMARGDSSVLIHFTEREDEVGLLAKALASLLVKLKSQHPFSQEEFAERKTETFGAASAYVPLGSATDIGVTLKTPTIPESITYFGQGVGVDTESQLCQILSLMMHTTTSSNALTKGMIESFAVCRSHLVLIEEKIKKASQGINKLEEENQEKGLYALVEEVRLCIDSLLTFSSYTQEIFQLQENQTNSSEYAINLLEQTESFVEEIFSWGEEIYQLTQGISSLCSETKILALNASIEAVRCGDKSRLFSSLSSEIRQKSQKTTETSEAVCRQLSTLKQSLIQFASLMKNLGSSVEAIKENLSQEAPLQKEQVERISNLSETLGKISTTLETQIGVEIEKSLLQKNLITEIQEVETAPQKVLDQINNVQESVEAFDASLPVYEEDEAIQD